MNFSHRAAPRGRRAVSCALAGLLAAQGGPGLQAAPPHGGQAFDAIDPRPDTRPAMLDLYRGEIRVVPVPGRIRRIAIGDGALVSANVVDGQLMLMAQKPGITSLVVWTGAGIALNTTVRIAKGNVHDTAAQLRSVLADVPGLNVLEKGPDIVLSGTIHRDVMERIKAATEGVPNLIDATTVDEGDALKKTIHFKVRIMELTHNAQESLGIQWDQKIAGPQVGAGGAVGHDNAGALPHGYVFAGISTKLSSMINLMINDGDAYVLASPELNTKSGGTATFLAGGQVPIPQAGALGTTDVEYKDYGIKLSIKPVVDANDVITGEITTEISQIDSSVSYGGYPGFLTRSARSDISLRAGETMAISGLVNADANGSVSRLPFLGRLPIIGRLFRSESFRSKRSDLVIFVTPMISDPMLSPNTELLSRADAIDGGFRQRHGDPSPLGQADGKAAAAARQPIGPTPPQPPGPLRAPPLLPSIPARPVAPPQPSRPPRGEPIVLDGARVAPPPGAAEPTRIVPTPIEWRPVVTPAAPPPVVPAPTSIHPRLQP